jgi:hypothetical protein
MKLTKTDFLICLNCSKNAWLKIYKPDIYKKKPLSAFDLSIMNSGNQIDELARGLFPGGELVQSRNDFEHTKKLIENKIPIIYQPAFSTDKFTAVSDIIIWNKDTELYDLYEVKSSTASEENGGRKTEDYLIDITFQKNVLDDLGVEIGKCNLIRINKEYIRNGDISLKDLFLIEEVTQEISDKLSEVRENMDGAYEVLSKEEEPTGYCDCIYKGINSHCSTSWYSNSDIPDYPVHAISRIKSKKLIELVDSNILSIYDVPKDFKLSDNQRMQIDTAQSKKEYIDRNGVAEFLEKIEYPISFIDYETYPSAIPKYDGYRPYQQIPFQFSLHIIKSPGAELEHFDFIYTGKECPDKFFSEALKGYIPQNGSVIVWNQRFEKGINVQISEHYPEYKELMENINDRVIDLMIPFYGKSTVYDHPDFKGSASIKYVLPALVPTLSYKDMHIQEGGTASDTWNKIISDDYSEEDKKKEIKALKDYCHLDTLAMVEIWKVLQSVI